MRKQIYKAILYTMLITMFTFCIQTGSVMALESNHQDGLKVEFTTDKEKYNEGDSINIIAKVTNTNDYAIENVSLENLLPSEMKLKEGILHKQVPTLEIGETIEISAVVTISSQSVWHADGANTGINNYISIYIIIFIASTICVILLLKKHKKVRKITSLILCTGLTISSILPVSIKATNQTLKSYETLHSMKVGNKDYTIKTILTYGMQNELFQINLDMGEIPYDDEMDAYYLAEETYSLKGEIISKSKLTEISYWICDDKNNTVKEGSVPIGSNFEIKNIAFVIGLNTLKIQVKNEKDEIQIEEVRIYNTNEENMKNLDVDRKDDDNDGLINYLETVFQTNPKLSDTDEDGLSDYEELVVLGNDPLNPDENGNGVLDGDDDYDMDSISNKEEFFLETDPLSKDSDFDNLNDNEEIVLATDPNIADTDNDGIDDFSEIQIGLNPQNPDTDGNGIEDGEEIIFTSKKADDIDGKTIPTVELNLKGEQINTLELTKLTNDDDFLSDEIPGFIDCGYDLAVKGTIKEAQINFEIEKSLFDLPNFEPRIYWFNEETQFLELLENQKIEDNKLSTTIEHFSKYIVLNKVEVEESWKDSNTTRNLVKEKSTITLGTGKKIEVDLSSPTLDYDNDGIPNIEEVKDMSSIQYGIEIEYHKIISNPLKQDSDGDGELDNKDKRPLQWDVSDRDLAIFSKLSYENPPFSGLIGDETTNELIKKLSEEMKDWKIRKVTVNKSNVQKSFSAITYSKDDNLIVAFRGTDNGPLKENWEYILPWVLHPQAKYAKRYIEEVCGLFDEKNIYLTGHSLGGALMFYATSRMVEIGEGSRLKGCASFNGLGLDKNASENEKMYASSLADKTKNYYIESRYGKVSDVVHSMGIHYGAPIPFKVTEEVLRDHYLELSIIALHDINNFFHYLTPHNRPFPDTNGIPDDPDNPVLNNPQIKKGESYRIQLLDDALSGGSVEVKATEDSIISYYAADKNDSDSVTNYKIKLAKGETIWTKYICDITVESGNLEIVFENYTDNGMELSDVCLYYPLDHEAVYGFTLTEGMKLTVENTEFFWADPGAHSVTINGSSHDQLIDYTEVQTSYWWNTHMGWPIEVKEFTYSKYVDFWAPISDSTKRDYEVQKGTLYIYLWYENKDKLHFNF